MHRAMISPSPVGSSNNDGNHPRIQQQLDDSFLQPYMIVPKVKGIISSSNQNVDNYNHHIDDVDFTATIESSINEATRWLQEGTTFGDNDGRRRPMMMMNNNQDWDDSYLNFQDADDNEEQEQDFGSFIRSSSVTPENDSSPYYCNDENEDEDFDFFDKQDFDEICMQQNDIPLPSTINSSMNEDFAQESQGFSTIEKIMSSSSSAMQQLSGIPTTVVSGEQQSSTASSQSTSQHQNDATAMTTITASSSAAAATAITTSQERRKSQIRASLIQRHYSRLQLIRRQRMELRRQMLIARAKRQLMFRRRQQQRMEMIMALKQRRAHALVASRLRHQQQRQMLNNMQPNDDVDCWEESFDYDEHFVGSMCNNTSNYYQQHQDYPTEISVSINTTVTDDSNTNGNTNNNGCNSSVADDGVSALTHPVELVSSSSSPPFRRPVVSRSSSMNNVVAAANHMNNSTVIANTYHRMMQQQQRSTVSDTHNNNFDTTSTTYHQL